MAQINLKIIKQFERAEGEAKGRAEGRAEGEAKGRAEGEAKGRAEGRAEGEASLLETLLTRKFGQLPEAVRVRLHSATPTDIERWAERVLTASTLDAVFAD